MRKAVSKASSWLKKYKILLVVDNDCPGNHGGQPIDWIQVLSPLVGSEGCLLFSARFRNVGNTPLNYKVEFDTVKDTRAAISVFDKHLGISEGDERYNVDVRDDIVERCGGLPLALSTAGLLVHQSEYQWESVEAVLRHRLVTAVGGSDAGGHQGLASTIGAALQKLDENEGRLLRSLVSMIDVKSLQYSWTEMYHALAVLPKESPSIPGAMLGILWNVLTVEMQQRLPLIGGMFYLTSDV